MITKGISGVREGWGTGLHCFGGAGSDSVEDACAHETAVCRCSSSPNHGGHADDGAPNQDCPSSEIGRNRNPEEIGKSKDENTHTGLPKMSVKCQFSVCFRDGTN